MSDDDIVFEIHGMDEFSRDLLRVAEETKGKECNRFMKNAGKKLAKREKEEFVASGAVAADPQLESEMKKTFKGGKVFKKDGDKAVRGYSSHPLTHLWDLGFIHIGGRGDKKKQIPKTGEKTFIPGYHFVDKASDKFEGEYYDDTEKFIDELLDKHNL